MRVLGQIGLLVAFVASGYSAFACMAGSRTGRRLLKRAGVWSGWTSLLALTVAVVVLARALLVKDFSFHYVAEYSSRLLPWHYSLSALWVGQAGSLLLWAWLLGVLAGVFRIAQRGAERQANPLREPAFGILMAYVCFLTGVMLFAADPMQANVAATDEGAGLSPLLQHPAMLIHPPIVFLGYAAWSVPFALALAALTTPIPLDATWARLARPWALFAWVVLGTGILLGAEWSYEELGWGGYWAWDPVENASLIPWLTGTALIHALMAWKHRGVLKKTAVALAIATFGLCNFATFLTRSGIFSSLHAFSSSPIGWLFLGLMIAIAAGGAVLLVRRRSGLTAHNRFTSIWTREAFVLCSAIALLLLAAVALLGTLSAAVSAALLGRTIVVGGGFYNNVLIPTGLILLTTLAAAPLLRWGAPPTPSGWRAMQVALVAAGAAVAVGWGYGLRHPLALVVTFLSALSALTLVAALLLETRRRSSRRTEAGRNRNRSCVWDLFRVLAAGRQQWAGFVIHLGFVCIAIGVTGSSLGGRRHELTMSAGQSIEWADRRVRFVEVRQQEHPDKFIAAAVLEVSRPGEPAQELMPAQHLHRLQDQWTTEADIYSSWGGDFYTILHSGDGHDAVRLTLVENPLMRWLWFGGWVVGAGCLIALWPSRRHAGNPRDVKRPGTTARKVIRSETRELAAVR